MKQFVEAVKQYAIRNYNEDGWDYVVECWSDEDIVDRTEGAATEAKAIQMVADWVRPLAEYRDEIRSTVW